jgi:nucleoside-diphosphate-sugar epimerase
MNGKGTVLVTGGSGFLGSWCVIKLLQAGYRVRTTVRDPRREGEVRKWLAPQVDAGDRLSFHAADLNSDDGWRAAIDGCECVQHVASPFPIAQPKDPQELIVPAREGALRVLRLANECGVKRVVMTSSIVAIRNSKRVTTRNFTEANFSDPDAPGMSPYGQSKTIAELAAWEFSRKNPKTELTVVCPGLILGPPLSHDMSTSLSVVKRMLDGKMSGAPKLSFAIVDVRDTADLHLLAMTSPEAGGQRYIAGGPSLWFGEIAKILHERLGADAAKVPTKQIPNLMVRIAALFDPGLRSIVGDLGVQNHFSIDKARALGWQPRPVADSIADTGRGLLALGQP